MRTRPFHHFLSNSVAVERLLFLLGPAASSYFILQMFIEMLCAKHYFTSSKSVCMCVCVCYYIYVIIYILLDIYYIIIATKVIVFQKSTAEGLFSSSNTEKTLDELALQLGPVGQEGSNCAKI